MGDHRANIKVEFTIHDKTYRHEWGWINYTDNGYGIDQRVVDWFDECWGDARGRWQAAMDEADAERLERAVREAELEELARLKAKYEAAFSYWQHDHLICMDCNELFEFCDPRIQSIQEMVAEIYQFEIERHSMQMYGHCRREDCPNREPEMRKA